MQVDKTTLHDLSIFHSDEDLSVFHHLNFTQTTGGRAYLHRILANPLNSISAINDTQETIRHLMAVSAQWPFTLITNGAIMVIEKFFETPVDAYPSHPGPLNSFTYKLLHKPDFSLTRYSVEHFSSFVRGLEKITELLVSTKSRQLQTWNEKISLLLHRPQVQEVLQRDKEKDLTDSEILQLGSFIYNQFKRQSLELIDIYDSLDAYLALALACKKYDFNFPVFEESGHPFIETKNLYHLLLPVPVAYNEDLNREKNFLFLTGANMAGKSTFIKAMGLSVYLAHIGMAVPGEQMRLSLFDGILSNINVVDNIAKGESYFFNEVQRIKNTIEKISDGKKWLILIDELFKGTNVQDAMKCSTAVIEGLRKMQNALFLLSTHLYEIGDGLRKFPNISFRYFETTVEGDQLIFSYQLKEGISNDRLGYLILKKEGVVEMLEKL